MVKRPQKTRWAIYLLRKRGELLGSVEAPDEQAAIRAAIEKFAIANPERKKRAHRSTLDMSRPYCQHCGMRARVWFC